MRKSYVIVICFIEFLTCCPIKLKGKKTHLKFEIVSSVCESVLILTTRHELVISIHSSNKQNNDP